MLLNSGGLDRQAGLFRNGKEKAFGLSLGSVK